MNKRRKLVLTPVYNNYAPIISDVQEVPVKSLVALAVFCVVFAAVSLAQSAQERQASGFDEEPTEWIATALHSIQAIKVGMTRSELMKVFTTEGGLEFKSATTSQMTYVYRKCPYIKVDVKLAISNPYDDLPSDKITEISRPYLAWTVKD